MADRPEHQHGWGEICDLDCPAWAGAAPRADAGVHDRCGYLLACPCWTDGATAARREAEAATPSTGLDADESTRTNRVLRPYDLGEGEPRTSTGPAGNDARKTESDGRGTTRRNVSALYTPGAALRAEGLDVERLAEVIERMFTTDDDWLRRAIEEREEWTFRDWAKAAAAEYARPSEQVSET